MSKIIQFPTKGNDEASKWAEIIDSAFTNVIPEIKESYKKEFVATLLKYSNQESIELSFPETITADQVKALKDAFAIKDVAIKEILQDLLIAKLEICKLQYKNS